ncbi:MAG: histidine kinase [Verrucomicrobiota bacterium JB022]|nr:histidine kinase [Verrucomicrobiota bacterium JB022]
MTVHPWIRKHLYWICQIGGWGTLGIILTIFSLVEDEEGVLDIITQSTLLTSACLFGTHYLRSIMKRRKWLTLRPRPALFRIIPTMLGVSLTFSVLEALLLFIITPEDIQASPQTPIIAVFTFLVLIIWLNLVILYVGWCGIYLGYKVTQRNHQLETERLRLQSSAKEAELRALRSQINPHFLFNCLNSLSSLIAEDPTRANQAVLHLAQMLRYNLRTSRAELVPLSQELQVVEGYLALEKIRFEDRLQIRYDIEHRALAGMIPPFIVQHLVENAIKYGISRKAAGGELQVAARAEGATLIICVSNPGELVDHGISTGTGLTNTRERLKLLFGEAAQLSLDNGPEGTVVAKAHLPFHTAHSLRPTPVLHESSHR